MRCTPKKTLQAAVDSGNDALVQLKGNQPKLLQRVMAIAQEQPLGDTHQHHQMGQRNRIESRSTALWTLAEGCLSAEWSLVRCVIQVQRHTEVFDTARAAWQPRRETAWYVCTRELTAAQAHHAVRGHWSVENALHHVRDVALGEDASRIRIRPAVFAQLRTCALNLLRQAGHHNIKAARQSIGWSEQALLHLCQRLQR